MRREREEKIAQQQTLLCRSLCFPHHFLNAFFVLPAICVCVASRLIPTCSTTQVFRGLSSVFDSAIHQTRLSPTFIYDRPSTAES